MLSEKEREREKDKERESRKSKFVIGEKNNIFACVFKEREKENVGECKLKKGKNKCTNNEERSSFIGSSLKHQNPNKTKSKIN